MAAKDAMEFFSGQPDNEEDWKKAWPLLCKDTAMEAHDVELLSVSEDKIVLRMEIDGRDRQPYGLLHGGISMMLAESAASSHSIWGLDKKRQVPVGIEINGSHIRSAKEGFVLAVGEVIRRSRTLIHHRVTIVEEKTGRELSVIRVTNLILER